MSLDRKFYRGDKADRHLSSRRSCGGKTPPDYTLRRMHGPQLSHLRGSDALCRGRSGRPVSAQRQVARRASLIAAAILAGAAVGGDWLLRKLGISLAAFRIAGGLLLFSIASEMVLGVRIERQSETAEQALEEHVRNVAASPLAIR